MTTMGTAVAEAIIYDYGTSVFLSRLIEPFWFQALGAVMGLDWPVETRFQPQGNFDRVVTHENAVSTSLDGRTVVDGKRGRHFFVGQWRQRSLF